MTTDDSNFFRDRIGKLNGNTGDIDASGLNVIDSSDSIIRGSESADEAPYQTVAAALVDLANGGNGVEPPADDEDDDDNGDDDPDGVGAEADEGDTPPGVLPIGTQPSPPTSPTSPPPTTPPPTTPPPTTPPPTSPPPTSPPPTSPPPTSPAPSPGVATAGVFAPQLTSGDDDDDDDGIGGDGFDFPYTAWTHQVFRDAATAVHTDEGTTLASGAEAIVIGADGYDDDDNRAVGENIVITRDDDNVIIGGAGKVNAQIGDAEQGVLVMDVARNFIQGGGAY